MGLWDTIKTGFQDFTGTGNSSARVQNQINRDFQENMSNTSWQRGVKDMEAAGINPMFAISQGGASTPSGNSGAGGQAASATAAILVNAAKLIAAAA